MLAGVAAGVRLVGWLSLPGRRGASSWSELRVASAPFPGAAPPPPPPHPCVRRRAGLQRGAGRPCFRDLASGPGHPGTRVWGWRERVPIAKTVWWAPASRMGLGGRVNSQEVTALNLVLPFKRAASAVSLPACNLVALVGTPFSK